MEKTSVPGVFKRGRSYVVVWRHRGEQRKSYHRTFAEAREEKGRRQAGDTRPKSRAVFEDYFHEWIEHYAGRTARGFSETTRTEYRRPIEDMALKPWGRWRLEEIEPGDVRRLFASARKAGASTSKVKKLRAALSVLFATAVEDEVLRSNPVQGVRIPAGPAGDEPIDEQAKALTRSELGVLLTALPEDWRLFFELLAHSGLRISEAIGLTWAHLDLGKRPRVLVREQVYRGERKRLKSGYARRDVPLSAGMAERLRTRRRDHYGGEGAPVFPSRVGTVLSPSSVRSRVLIPAAESVGLRWMGFHTLRHTCASLLFEAGKNVKQVQEWLGHADPGFTLRTYVHLMDDGLGDADFLDLAVFPAGKDGQRIGQHEPPKTADIER